MKDETINNEILNKFGYAAKEHYGSNISKTEEEWQYLGLNLLKRKTLGLFRRSVEIEVDELSDMLVDLKIANSTDEGKSVIKSLYDKKTSDTFKALCPFVNDYWLAFAQTNNKSGIEVCRIEKLYDVVY